MAAEQRKLLQQLMGEQLLSGPGGRSSQLSITDPKACRSYIVGTCPHDLFTNTKQDIGLCPKVHSEPLKSEYEAAQPEQKKRWAFEYDYIRDMRKYIEECDRRIDTAQRRLEKTPDEIRQTNTLLKQISDLSKSINYGVDEVRVLAEEGSVNQAVAELFKLRQSRFSKEDRERELKALSDTSGSSGHQKLQVCDVCGAYLSRLDNDRRLADHFYGRMHLGFAQMRKTYASLQKELKGKPPPQRTETNDGSSGGRGEFEERGYGRSGQRSGGSGRGGYGRSGRNHGGRW